MNFKYNLVYGIILNYHWILIVLVSLKVFAIILRIKVNKARAEFNSVRGKVRPDASQIISGIGMKKIQSTAFPYIK